MKKKLKYYQKAGKYTNVKPSGGETGQMFQSIASQNPDLLNYKNAFLSEYPDADEDVANSVAIIAYSKKANNPAIKKQFLTKLGGGDYFKGYSLYNEFINQNEEVYEKEPKREIKKGDKYQQGNETMKKDFEYISEDMYNTNLKDLSNMKKKMQKGQMFPSFPIATPTSNKGVSDAEYNSNRELYLRADKLIYDLAKLEEDMKESAYYLQKNKNYEVENTISALKKRRNEILSEYNFIKDRIGDDIDEIIPNEMFNRVINYDFVKGETKNPKSNEIAYDRAIEMTTDKKQSKKQSRQDLANVSTKDLWEMLTQSSWQEAKKQGLTDGSAEQNLALRTKLIEGNADLLKQKFSGKELQFAKGGKVYGASHQEGGVPAVDANTGEQVAEVEGGERIFSREDTQAMEQMVMQIANAKSEQEGNQLAMQLGYMVAEMIMEQMQRQGKENMGQDMEEMPMKEEAMPMAMGGRKLKANKVLELLNSY
jgi:hypothetical protein